MSYDLGDPAALDAADLDASASGSATASSSGWGVAGRRGRARHVPPHRRAFHRFYREHFGLVWSMVRRFGVPAAQHEDAVQEVWLVAYRRLHTLEPDASAKAWLSTIARRVASRLRRTEHRKHRKLAAIHVTSDRDRGPAPGRVDEHDARRLLAALWAVLDDDQRDVLVLAQVHGLSGPEIAQVLAIPLNTAYSRLRLARRRVDRFVAEVGTEEAAVIRALRRSEEPPPRAAAQAWLVLAPQLGWGTAGTTAIGGWLGGLAGVKAFATVVLVGAVGIVAARSVVDARAAGAEPSPIAAVRAQRTEAGPVDREAAMGEGLGSRAEPMVAVDASGAATAAGVRVDPQRPSRDAAGAVRGGRAGARASSSASPASDGNASASARQAVPAEAAPSATTLTAEAGLLGRAQQALRAGDAAEALRWLDEHERRFPSGELGVERRGARVRALCELGRSAQARAEAQQLQREHPSSPVAAGVADACS